MRHVEREIDHILDRYLEGVLTAEEVRVLHRQLDDELPSGDVQVFLDKIELPDDVIYGKPLGAQKEVKINYRIPLPIDVPAARSDIPWLVYGILGLLLLTLPLFLYIIPLQQQQKIFDRYFQPYSITAVQQQFNDQSLEDLWRTAIFKYNNSNYLQCAKTLEGLLATQTSEAYITHFYIGLSYLNISESEYALPHLEEVANGVNPLRHQAKWYIALAHLQLNELEVTKTILEHIAKTPDAYNRDEAVRALKDID